MSYLASISAGSDWLSIRTGASGGNSGTLRIFFAENSGVQRTGQITVMANGANGSPTTITITQAGKVFAPTPTPTPTLGPVLTVLPVDLSAAMASGRANFTVSNTGVGIMNYSARVSEGSSWLQITSGASGGSAGLMKVSFTQNAGTQRTGRITVTGNGANGSPVTITVTQAGKLGGATPTPTATPQPTPSPSPASVPVLTVIPPSSSMAFGAGRANFIVSNTGAGTISYSASISAGSNWLQISSGASGGNSGVIKVAYAENTGVQRTGQITVIANGANGSPMTITIFQDGNVVNVVPSSNGSGTLSLEGASISSGGN